MKKKWNVLLATTVLTAGILSGCGSDNIPPTTTDPSPSPTASTEPSASPTASQKPAADGKELKSKDESVQITVPKDWKENDSLNAQAILGAANLVKEKYVIAVPFAKSEFADDTTLDDFMTVANQNIEMTAENTKISETKDIQIDGIPAKQAVISAEITGIKVRYLITYLEKGNRFYQLAAWTLDERYDEYEEEFTNVINSFRVLKDDVETTAGNGSDSKTSGKDVVLTDSADLTEITLPGGWTEANGLNDEADLQALNLSAGNENYLMVLNEPKTDFDDGFTLQEYYDLIMSMQTDGSLIGNAVHSDPVETDINGNKGIQFEVRGEVDKVKIAYLFTLVESENGFHQVIFWTNANKMDDNKQTYIDATNTFKVKK